MKRRHSLITTLIVLIITIAAIGVFVMILVHGAISAPPEPELPIEELASTTPITPINPVASDIPTRLVIPHINVDAKIVDVGISIHKTMAVPLTYTDVGWYRYGSKPGEAGNAVFDGHLDNGFGRAGVFQHLKDLNIGDDIFVTIKNGTKLHFKVTAHDTFSYDISNTSDIFSKKGTPSLKIITCEGEWNAEQKMYSDRHIVTAELVSS